MKKFLLTAVVLLGSISMANAEKFSIGVTATGAVFEADGASEVFSGDHAGNRSSTTVTKSSADEGEDAEAAVAMGSIFVEAAMTDQVSLGINYVPHSMASETTENVQKTTIAAKSTVTNKVQIDFEDYLALL